MCFVGLGCPVFKIWYGVLVMGCDWFMLVSCSVLMATSGLFRLVSLNGWSRAPRGGRCKRKDYFKYFRLVLLSFWLKKGFNEGGEWFTSGLFGTAASFVSLNDVAIG